jgi:hypothetical protein
MGIAFEAGKNAAPLSLYPSYMLKARLGLSLHTSQYII